MSGLVCIKKKCKHSAQGIEEAEWEYFFPVIMLKILSKLYGGKLYDSLLDKYKKSGGVYVN